MHEPVLFDDRFLAILDAQCLRIPAKVLLGHKSAFLFVRADMQLKLILQFHSVRYRQAFVGDVWVVEDIPAFAIVSQTEDHVQTSLEVSEVDLLWWSLVLIEQVRLLHHVRVAKFENGAGRRY